MHLSRRAARTPLALLGSAALVFSVAVGVTSPAAAYTPVVKPASTTVAVGTYFTIAMVGNGAIYGTGTNSDGQLPGRSAGEVLTTLTPIDSLPDAAKPVALAAGDAHSVALGNNGKVYAVGYNNTGQLANGFTNTASPATWAPVMGLPAGAFPVEQIAAAGINTYVLGADGEVYGAGWNDSHQISLAATSEFNTMQQIAVPGTVNQIAAGGPNGGFDGFLLAKNTGGYVFGRGDNSSGQLNQAAGADVTAMTLFPGSSGNATTIAAGGASSYIATSSNAVLAVGQNLKGQLGNNSTAPTSSLVTMTPPFGGFAPVAIAAGDNHVVVAPATGTVYAAGAAGAGAVASGSVSPDKLVLSPVEEGGGVTIGTPVEVDASGNTSLIRNSEGLLLGSGNGFQGQLTGTPGNHLSVEQLTGQWLSNYVKPSFTSPIKVGEVANALPGSWSVNPTGFTYEWFNDGAAIGGATSQAYTIKPEDLGDPITVKVTGTRSGFTAYTYPSDPVTPGAGTFDVDADPVITGTPAVGQVLGIDERTWTPAATFGSYQWRRNGVPIELATGDTYTVQAADLSHNIDAAFTGSAPGYADLPTTTDTVVAIAGTVSNYTPPTISGTPKAGQTLTANNGAWLPTSSPTVGYQFAYQWYRAGVPIVGATAKTRRLSSTDAGKSMTVEVVAHVDGYTDATASSAGRIVALYATKRPTFSGTAKKGKTLKLRSRGTWLPSPSSYTYRWNRNGKPISGANKTSYKIKKADRGKYLTLTVTAKKPGIPSGISISARSKKVKK